MTQTRKCKHCGDQHEVPDEPPGMRWTLTDCHDGIQRWEFKEKD